MTIEQVVVERLLDLSAVTALVGTRIFQLKVSQTSPMPAIRVQLISQVQPYHLRGGVRMVNSRVQVDAFAAEASGIDPYAQASALADAIRGDDAGSGLSGWTALTGGSPPEVHVWAAFCVDRSVDYHADELRLVGVRQDYSIFWAAA